MCYTQVGKVKEKWLRKADPKWVWHVHVTCIAVQGFQSRNVIMGLGGRLTEFFTTKQWHLVSCLYSFFYTRYHICKVIQTIFYNINFCVDFILIICFTPCHFIHNSLSSYAIYIDVIYIQTCMHIYKHIYVCGCVYWTVSHPMHRVFPWCW